MGFVKTPAARPEIRDGTNETLMNEAARHLESP